MNEQSVDYQSNLYVYDLKNCAREFGFKADETWEIGMSSSQEKAAMERKYFPTLAVEILPEFLPAMLGAVKNKLSHPVSHSDNASDANLIRQYELQYLTAYSPNRLRR